MEKKSQPSNCFIIRPEVLLPRGCKSHLSSVSCHCRRKNAINDQAHYGQTQGFNKVQDLKLYEVRPQKNWVRYNILVGIYDNWIRLAPLIKHLLGCK